MLSRYIAMRRRSRAWLGEDRSELTNLLPHIRPMARLGLG